VIAGLTPASPSTGLAPYSASRIALYLQCPRRAAYQYLEGLREPPSATMARGTAAHGGIEYLLRRQMGGSVATDEEIADATRDAAAKAAAEVEWSADDADERQGLADRAIAYALGYARQVAPTLRVVDVEKPFRVSIVGTELVGRIDVVAEDSLRDTKTAQRAPTPAWGDPRSRLQLGFYALAWDVMSDEFDPAPMSAAIDTLVLTERTPRATKANPTPTTTREVRHLPLIIESRELVDEMAAARSVLEHVHERAELGDYPRNPTACYAWMRPCPHLGRCIPGRASAVERSEAMKIAVSGDNAEGGT
jgi:RecB family exonuclease